jgi:hypothetical protein
MYNEGVCNILWLLCLLFSYFVSGVIIHYLSSKDSSGATDQT